MYFLMEINAALRTQVRSTFLDQTFAQKKFLWIYDCTQVTRWIKWMNGHTDERREERRGQTIVKTRGSTFSTAYIKAEHPDSCFFFLLFLLNIFRSSCLNTTSTPKTYIYPINGRFDLDLSKTVVLLLSIQAHADSDMTFPSKILLYVSELIIFIAAHWVQFDVTYVMEILPISTTK